MILYIFVDSAGDNHWRNWCSECKRVSLLSCCARAIQQVTFVCCLPESHWLETAGQPGVSIHHC